MLRKEFIVLALCATYLFYELKAQAAGSDVVGVTDATQNAKRLTNTGKKVE